ncbi:MAG TPA: hypothetical protein VE968_01910 [Sphingomicrobium sp.]|nr:hypothetical protein [Sphingomicrobium sp.]
MRGAWLACVVLCSAAIHLSSAHAQVPLQSAPIVVRGVHDRDKQIRDFIHEMTPAPVRGQLSRFEAPVCPAVAGLAAQPAALVIARIARVASAAGLKIATKPCDANIILIVTNDKNALLKKLEKLRPEYFPPDWSTFEVHDLEHDPYPVAVWQFEGATWADGRPIGNDIVAATTDVMALQRTTEPQGRLHPSARHQFELAIVVVQRSALSGLTTTQLADYVAMRALVRTEPKYLDKNADTILNIIDAPMGSAVPLTLTRWDLSFLKAFYASGKNSYAEYQRAEMQQLMKADLEQSEQTAF